MRTFGNIIWHFPFFGFMRALCYAIVGLFWCITIIGIPIGLGLFQMALFMLAPFTHELVTQKDMEILTGERQNTGVKAWFIVVRILYFPVGLLLAICSIFTIASEFLSLIGIPCGLVEAKALSAIFNPVNKKCVPLAVAQEIQRRKAAWTTAQYTTTPPVPPVPNAGTTSGPIPPIPPVAEAQRNQAYAPKLQPQPTQATTRPEAAPQPPHPAAHPIPPVPPLSAPQPSKGNKPLIIGLSAGVVVLAVGLAVYAGWYRPYAKDRDALRTYVLADKLFLRSSKTANSEANIIGKLPYGSELITYEMDGKWAKVKTANGKAEGFMASAYLLEPKDYHLLDGIWGSPTTRQQIESSKCRLALVDYCKRNHLETGSNGWQLHTLQRPGKPDNVSYPRLNNGYDKFSEFAFILKDNTTGARRLALYSFDEESEKPKLLHEQDAPADGEIQAVSYRNGRYGVRFSTTPAPDRHTAQEEQHTISAPPVTPSKENIVEQVVEAVENDAITTEDIAESTPEEEPERPAPAEDNDTYEVVEEMPKYPGGTEAMMAFIGQHLQYPSVSIENGVQGRVVVQFVIEKDGTPTDFKVIRSVDPYLDKEAIRVLSLMPKWTPGRQRGVPVKVRYTVPVTFRLQ